MRRRYVVPCFRGGDREAHCESAEEATACTLLDACFGLQFQEQPAKLVFEWRGQHVAHWPDLLVVSDAGATEFWECKRDHEARDLWVRRRTERLQELLAGTRFGYRIVATSELSRGAYFENARRLRRRAKLDVPLTFRECLAEALTDGNRAMLSDLTANDPLRIDWVLGMLYRGELLADLRDPISATSRIRAADERRISPWVWELFERSS